MAEKEYIERDPLLTKAKSLQGGAFSTPLIVEQIEQAPAADVVEVRHGKWIAHTNSDGNLNHYECSICHKAQGYISNYCEDCGTNMNIKDEWL